jgi:hypothetical protein
LTNVPERVVEVKEVGRLWEERPHDDSGEHKYEKKRGEDIGNCTKISGKLIGSPLEQK